MLVSSQHFARFFAFFNPLFPNACMACESLLVPGEKQICSFCRHEFPLTGQSFGVENKMDWALYGRCRFEKASALFYYHKTGALKHCLQYLKYRKQEQISYFFGRWHGHLLANDPHFPELDCIIPVPLHPKKKKKRGYNQLSGYGKALSEILGIPFLEKAVIKTTNTKTQTKKNRGLRFQNATSLFTIPKPEALYDKRILIIYDVMTTGATLALFSEAFESCSGRKLYIVCLAFVA